MTCARPEEKSRIWRATDAVHIDVRGLDPPEPMVAILQTIDGGEQPFAALAVQALDRLPQLADRLDDVLAFGHDQVEAVGQFLLLLLGSQIDRAQPFDPERPQVVVDRRA